MREATRPGRLWACTQSTQFHKRTALNKSSLTAYSNEDEHRFRGWSHQSLARPYRFSACAEVATFIPHSGPALSASRTTHLLDTLCSKNEFENLAEVEVTDPFHPLFGRRFPLISSSSTITGPGYVWAAYRDYMRLRIPLSATSLVSSGPISRTKFTRQGLEELLALASEYEGLCQSTPQKSGRSYQNRSDSKSKKNSSPSSRR